VCGKKSKQHACWEKKKTGDKLQVGEKDAALKGTRGLGGWNCFVIESYKKSGPEGKRIPQRRKKKETRLRLSVGVVPREPARMNSGGKSHREGKRLEGAEQGKKSFAGKNELFFSKK